MATAGLAILLLSLCALSVEGIRSVPSVAVAGDAPDFCHDADCPKFSTKEEHDEYDIREYEKGVTRRSTRRCGGDLRQPGAPDVKFLQLIALFSVCVHAYMT